MIPRCVKPPGFGEPVVFELHSFSDASDVGLGQVTYLRLVNSSNQVHVSFLMGKARVAPLKPMSTPRRELTAAVISVNVASMLKRELNYKHPVEVFYTDSSVVLGYIRNEAKRFHTYVGNRVHHIHERSKPEQWHYVPALTTQLTLPHEAQPPSNLQNMSCGSKAQVVCGRQM